MINKSNWKMTRRYLDYRLQVDQVSPDSMEKEKTHLRYLLEWAQETSFSEVVTHRPTFPEFLLVHRLDGHQGHLSAVYIKKILSTVRMFFTWVSDNGYKNIKQAWVKTIKVKRLSDVPKNKEIVTLEEILAIARAETLTREERRARASLVFLYLSGMRIGAFVSLPVRCVDISNRLVDQFPSLGVRTKNGKHATTYLLDIPELLHVVQSWHDEVVLLLPHFVLIGFLFYLLNYLIFILSVNLDLIWRGEVSRRGLIGWDCFITLPINSGMDIYIMV
jgi:site-specific recombinase XerD